ncbi:hypothetical protein XENOCAPTIV_025332 [Xenoophorus captivus]|uniref:Uncharacterized protein n=1 Tax=Xenoophorus captivus TaxID=1517983 RepID=A0ABV0R6J3_9TELE
MSAGSGASTVNVLLDPTSAFDTVDHSMLNNRLRDVHGLSGVALGGLTFVFLAEHSLFCNPDHVRLQEPAMWGATGLSLGTYSICFVYFPSRPNNQTDVSLIYMLMIFRSTVLLRELNM